MTTELIYGFDALCGWCYGFVPAMRRLRAEYPDLPVRLALPGLVTGDRVGPYADMEGYIRGAAERLRAVTGRAPDPAFYDLILRPGVRGDSGPPTLALDAVRALHPRLAVDFAHQVIEAHFGEGRDLNDPATYARIAGPLRIGVNFASLGTDAAPIWARDRATGIASFPTLILVRDGHALTLPTDYDPASLAARIAAVLAG